MRKFLSLLLSLCLIASLSISAFAADDFGSDPSVDSMDGAEILNITVPDEILLHMNQDGSVQVAQTHVIQNHSQGDVCVKSIDVSGCDDWRVVAFDSDLSSFDANTHVLALSFRGDGTCDTGSVVLSDDNWVIARDSSLPINVSVNMPEQSASDKSKIAMISWDVDWVDSDGSIYPIEVPVFDSEHGQSDIDRVLTDESGRIPVFPNVIPDEGYLFDTWVDQDNNPVDGTTVFTPDDSIRPVFKPDPDYNQDLTVVVAVLPGEHGTCNISSVTTTSEGKIHVYPAVTPDAGWVLDHWANQNGELVDENTVFYDGSSICPVFAPDPDYNVAEHIDLIVTADNRDLVGFTGASGESLQIPARFVGDDGIDYTVVGIGDNAFYGCNQLVDVDVPETVISIGASAFSKCTSLSSISLPDGLVSIGAKAFSNCSSLTSVILPESLTALGRGAFMSCTSLYDINIPSQIRKLAKQLFAGCTALTEFEIPAHVKALDNSVFGATGLVHIEIPNTVTTFGTGLFSQCESLESCVLPDNMKEIPISMFWICPNLVDVNIPASVTKIQWGAFSRCPKLGNGVFRVPTTVLYMNARATFVDSGITVYIPNTVSSSGVGGSSYDTTCTYIYY